jgi:uncharacterized membrane protein
MRTIALLFLLFGALTYLLPDYRSLVPLEIPLGDKETVNVASALVILGLVALVVSRRST